MNIRSWLIFVVLFAAVVRCDQYGPVLKAIDGMIAREEQRRHLLSHTQDEVHSHFEPLPHDLGYTNDYSMKDLANGIAYVEALRGAGKPQLPVFTEKDKTDFTRVEVPTEAQFLSEQEALHQKLTEQQALLENQRKEKELNQKTLEELIKEEDKMQNPLHNVPTFDTEEPEGPYVDVCTPDMPDGIPCPGGRCEQGKCKQDRICYGDCCQVTANGTVAVPHGTPCAGGHCLEGRCRIYPVCIGECCSDENKSVAKPDGTVCKEGHCFDGGCVSDVGCTKGQCCNAHKKRLFPKGFPCHAGLCQEKSFCNGLSADCPESYAKDDGSVCVGGKCDSGVCTKTGIVSTNSTEKICSEGLCCDENGTYLPKGTPCSNNPCATGGVCTGKSSECTISHSFKHDGASCPNGKCKDGMCVAIAECDSDDECCVDGVLLPDYNACNGGRCFRGKCVIEVPCVGECCKPLNETDAKTPVLSPQPNGTPCNNSTNVCENGRCVSVPICVGECCELSGVSKDGNPCGMGIGKCVKGMCVDQTATCTNGTCCDETTGLLRPKGYSCRAHACSETMVCTGAHANCPVSLIHTADGTPCPGNGKCFGGVCVLPPPGVPDCHEGPCCNIETLKFLPAGTMCSNETCHEPTFCSGSSRLCPVPKVVIPDGTVCHKTDKPVTDWKCESGICVEPPPVFSAANVDIDTTRNECHVTSGCCNTQIGRVRPRGYVCSVAQSACMKDVVCDGETPMCEPYVLEDGSMCPGGACVHGVCVSGIDPTDSDAVHEVHIHTVPKKYGERSPEEALALSFMDDDEEEDEEEGSVEQLMTIITREGDGSISERSMRIPANMIQNMKKKSLGLAGESIEVSERKAKEREERVNAAAQLLLEEKKLNATLEKEANTTTVTTTTETTEPAKVEEAPVDAAVQAFTTAYPMPKAGVVDPLTGIVRLRDAASACTTGKCCDVAHGVFFTRGFQCDTPKNLCKVSACSGYSETCHTMNRPDGASCPGGRCLDGECIKNCVGECCDHHDNPRPDGVKCGPEGNGFCFDGACVRECEGECCNEHKFAKPDGSRCANGFCLEGKCLQTRDNSRGNPITSHGDDGENIFLTGPKQDGLGVITEIDEFGAEIPTYTHGKTVNKEEEWNKLKQKEAEELERERELEAERIREEQELMNMEAFHQEEIAKMVQEQLAAKHETEKDNEKSNNTLKLALIIGGSCVGVLAIVAIIVAVVASKRTKASKTKSQEFEDYYDKF